MNKEIENSVERNVRLKQLIAKKKVYDKDLQGRSKTRLKENTEKRIKTTMIGALNAIEKTFGHLWSGSSEEEEYMSDLFKKVRNDILDIGNNQIRDAMLEIDQYEVEWNGKYTIVLPVKEG